MSSLHFIRIELGRALKSFYFWLFLALALFFSSVLPAMGLFKDYGMPSKAFFYEYLDNSIWLGIAYVLPIFALLFIVRDFSSKYIQRLSLLLGGWQRIMLLKWVVLVILSVIIGLGSALMFPIIYGVAVAFDPDAGQYTEKVIYRPNGTRTVSLTHADFGDIFHGAVGLSMIFVVIVSVLVGSLAFFIGWATRGVVIFIVAYFPLISIVEQWLVTRVSFSEWYVYRTNIGNAVKPHFPEEDGALGELAGPSNLQSVLILLAYAAVALALGLWRSRRSPLL